MYGELNNRGFGEKTLDVKLLKFAVWRQIFLFRIAEDCVYISMLIIFLSDA